MGCGTSQLWQCLEEVHLLRSAGQISMCQIQQLAECTWLNEYRNVQQNSIEKLDLLEILKSKGLWVSFMFSCTADETLTKKSPYRRKGRTAIYNYYWLQRNISKLCNKDTLRGNWREIFSQATPAVLIVHSTSLSACVAMFISKRNWSGRTWYNVSLSDNWPRLYFQNQQMLPAPALYIWQQHGSYPAMGSQ